jgi:hypothetical protein
MSQAFTRGSGYRSGSGQSRSTPWRAHPEGVFARIAQRLLALATAIWHNRTTKTTSLRSLTGYDH